MTIQVPMKEVCVVCTKLFCRAIYCANTITEPDYQSGSLYRRALGRWSLRIIWEYDITNVIAIRPLNYPNTCEMGSSSFSAMSWLKCMSTTRYLFPSLPSSEETDGEKSFCWSWKWLPCSYFFYFSHQARRFPIISLFWESQYRQPSLVSIMASVWLPQKSRMKMYPIVSIMNLPWRTPSYDLLWSWWIRGSPHTQWGEMDHCES